MPATRDTFDHLRKEQHMTTHRKTSRKPTRKVAAGGTAGAVTVLAVWGASLAGVHVPPEAASAFTTVVSFVAAYLPNSYGTG